VTNAVAYALGDSIRADGYQVRYARLGMLTPTAQMQWVLCWVMECCFAAAYFYPKYRRTSILVFWLAYLAIIHLSLRG
jgi:hypothetical protein